MNWKQQIWTTLYRNADAKRKRGMWAKFVIVLR